MESLGAQDVEAVVSDYAEDGSIITQEVTVTGTAALRDFVPSMS